MTTRTIQLTDSVYQYLLNQLREPAVLKKLREETAKMPKGHMQISPEQGQLLAFLVELIGAKKTLELGVFTGYSALVVALALPPDGHLIACDINAESSQTAKQFWQIANVAHKIDLRIAPALETLDQLIKNGEANSFDFIFIDADKKNYPEYYEYALQLLRPGGLLAIDNVLQYGKVADLDSQDEIVEVIRKLNKKIQQDNRVAMCLLPISDGLTLVRKISQA